MRPERKSLGELQEIAARIGRGTKVQTSPITARIAQEIFGGAEAGLPKIGSSIITGSNADFEYEAAAFMEQYVTALSDPKNLTIASRARYSGVENADNAMNLYASNFIDLNIFNEETKNALKSTFETRVARLQRALQHPEVGLPGQSLPSENPFSLFNRFITDSYSGLEPGAQPSQYGLLLSKLNIRMKKDASLLTDITIGNRIPNPIALARQQARTASYGLGAYDIGKVTGAGIPSNIGGVNIFGLTPDADRIYTMMTFDSETTGRAVDSQVRALAVAKRRFKYTAEGVEFLGGPEVTHNAQFLSKQMDVAHNYYNGVRLPLSEVALRHESTGGEAALARSRAAFDNGGEIFVQDMKKIFTDLLDADFVGGHYAENFDVDKIIGTLMPLEAFKKDTEMQRLIRAFQMKRIEDPHFFFDTHSLVGEFFERQKSIMRDKISGQLKNADGTLSSAGQELTNELMTQFEMASELFAKGSSTPQSMQNIILNSNLLSLISQESPEEVRPLLDAISKRGTHTGDVDALLEDFVAKHIHTGKLQMQRFPIAGMPAGKMSEEAKTLYHAKAGQLNQELSSYGFVRHKDAAVSELEEYIRRMTLKSSAVTPTTNIAGVDRISEELFKHLSETKSGQQKITLAIDKETLANELGMPGTPSGADLRGELFYNKKSKQFQFRNLGTGDTTPVDEKLARDYVQRTLRDAREGTANKKITLGYGPKGEEISTMVNPGDYRTTDIHFTNIQGTQFDQMVAARRQAANITPTSGGLSPEDLSITDRYFYDAKNKAYNQVRVGESVSLGSNLLKTEEYTKNLLQKGLPFADIDVSSRVMGVANAKASINVGRTILKNSVNASDQRIATALDSIAGMDADGSTLGLLAENGIQFFQAQGKEKLFDPSSTRLPNNYFRLPTVDQTGGKAAKIIMTADDFLDLEIREKGSAPIKFGSQAFLEDTQRLNRFYQSRTEDFVNQVFKPQDLARETLEDLADQVMEKQVRRLGSAGKNISDFSRARADISSLNKSIFGIDGTAEVEKLFSLNSTERAAHLESMGEHVVQNYQRVRVSLADNMEIIAFNQSDPKVVDAYNAASISQKVQVAEEMDNPDLVSSIDEVYRGIGGDAEGITGASFTPYVDQTVSSAVDETMGKPALSLYEQGQRAKQSFESSAVRLAEGGAFTQEAQTATKAATKTVKEQHLAAWQGVYNRGKTFVKTHPRETLIGAFATAATIGAYQYNKRKKENENFESTIAPQRVEYGDRPYGIQDATFRNQQNQSRDPLSTAGVVGNLDKSKIGHVTMGAKKYNKLFVRAARELV